MLKKGIDHIITTLDTTYTTISTKYLNGRFSEDFQKQENVENGKGNAKISTGRGAPVTGILTISHPSAQRNIVSLAGLDTGTVDTSSHTSEGAMT